MKAPLLWTEKKYGAACCVTELEIPYGIYKTYVLLDGEGEALK